MRKALPVILFTVLLAGCGGGWLWLFLAVLVVVGVGACPFCLDTLIPAFELGRAR